MSNLQQELGIYYLIDIYIIKNWDTNFRLCRNPVVGRASITCYSRSELDFNNCICSVSV